MPKAAFALIYFLFAFVPAAAAPAVTLTHLTGNVYVAEDTFYARENSAVYVGRDHVAVVGATWAPQTAKLLVTEIRKVTDKPVTEVIDTSHDLDRAGGNAYFRSIGERIVAIALTRDSTAPSRCWRNTNHDAGEDAWRLPWRTWR